MTPLCSRSRSGDKKVYHECFYFTTAHLADLSLHLLLRKNELHRIAIGCLASHHGGGGGRQPPGDVQVPVVVVVVVTVAAVVVVVDVLVEASGQFLRQPRLLPVQRARLPPGTNTVKLLTVTAATMVAASVAVAGAGVL